MSELAGWGRPSFLPPAVAARAARDEAREAIAARRAEDERERRTEERHAQALDAYRAQAEARGEVFDVLAMARGEVRGRTVPEILASAAAAAAAVDRGDEMRAWRDGHGEPEKLHIEFIDDPQLLPAARSETGRKIASRSRRFRDWQEKRKAAEAARRALESSLDHGLVEGVNPRPREDRDAVVFARHQYERACAEIGQRPVSYR
jgi:hypothetical protein